VPPSGALPIGADLIVPPIAAVGDVAAPPLESSPIRPASE
jgi:hypothetical protein